MTNVIIMLLEDSMDDVFLIETAFEELPINATLKIMSDGEQALKYLETEIPDLAILDMNVPKIDGLQVLKAMKLNEPTKHIPVVMLTTSDRHADIFKFFHDGGTAYIKKPLGYNELLEVLASFDEFWFKTSILPKPE